MKEIKEKGTKFLDKFHSSRVTAYRMCFKYFFFLFTMCLLEFDYTHFFYAIPALPFSNPNIN